MVPPSFQTNSIRDKRKMKKVKKLKHSW